jgi:hypothetical protein
VEDIRSRVRRVAAALGRIEKMQAEERESGVFSIHA